MYALVPPARRPDRVLAPPPAAAKQHVGPLSDVRFALLIHPTDDEALFGIMPASLRDGDAQTRERWLAWAATVVAQDDAPARVLHIERVVSATGFRRRVGWA